MNAIAAGKDVYVEKPASNTVARINAMLNAYKKASKWFRWGPISGAGITSSRLRRS